jgi:acylphosphatase
MKTVMIRVKGRVQGVYFRQSARDMATMLGVSGTVNNERDGSVKIVATGTDELVQKLVAWCHRGPSSARVESVDVEEIALQDFNAFVILR